MLKILLMVISLISFVFYKKKCWMVHSLLFFMSFMLILMNMYGNYFMSISYLFGCDLFSYGLMLLSFWIISLMFIASESVYKYKNYEKLFMLNMLFLLLMLVLTFFTWFMIIFTSSSY